MTRSWRFAGLFVALCAWHGIGQAAATAAGQALAFARDKGNCLACHVIEGGSQMGDIGPPLVDTRRRFPERARLVAQLRDPGRFNDHSLMPPYGRHEILSAAEIEAIVDFLYSL